LELIARWKSRLAQNSFGFFPLLFFLFTRYLVKHCWGILWTSKWYFIWAGGVSQKGTKSRESDCRACLLLRLILFLLVFLLHVRSSGIYLNARARVHRPSRVSTGRPVLRYLKQLWDNKCASVITYKVACISWITHFAGEPLLSSITLETQSYLRTTNDHYECSYGGINPQWF